MVAQRVLEDSKSPSPRVITFGEDMRDVQSQEFWVLHPRDSQVTHKN